MAHSKFIQKWSKACATSCAAAVGVFLLSTAPVAMAAGGGGGGGGSAPSQSAPQYDPAEEHRKGVAALNAEQYDQAAKHFKRVTRVARKDPNSNYLLGVAYMLGGDAKKARKQLERALKYDPQMLLAQRDLGIVYAQLGRADDANAMLEQIRERQAACGAQCADKAKLDQAIANIEGALNGERVGHFGPSLPQLADASTGDAVYASAVGLINEGQYELALVSLSEAGVAFGPHPDILTYQGFANRKLGRFDVAERYYNRALAIAPDHLGALEYYGELKVERGDLKGAKEHLAKLDQLCSFGCYEAEELRVWIQKAS